jgi:hypothetical protein
MQSCWLLRCHLGISFLPAERLFFVFSNGIVSGRIGPNVERVTQPAPFNPGLGFFLLRLQAESAEQGLRKIGRWRAGPGWEEVTDTWDCSDVRPTWHWPPSVGKWTGLLYSFSNERRNRNKIPKIVRNVWKKIGDRLGYSKQLSCWVLTLDRNKFLIENQEQIWSLKLIWIQGNLRILTQFYVWQE